MPKISIILSSYNHAKYICEAIESTLNQTFTDFELLIVDDGSSDNSWELINQYSDPRIKTYRNEVNLGGTVGVNRAISKLVSGNYIAIHHSDDVWELDKLEKQIHFLEQHPKVGAVFTNALAIGEDSAPLNDTQHRYSNTFNQPNQTRQQWLNHFFYRGNALCHPSILIRKSCYENCGVYRYDIVQLTDFEMWVRLCMKYEIHVLPEKLVRFRVRAGELNASGNRPEVRIRDRTEFHNILKHYFHIKSFEELASIFPEAKKYYRPTGFEPKFVMAMIALGDHSLPWAKFLGIETLFDLLADKSKREKIKELYQFGYRDFVALTGKHDLFSLESVASLRQSLEERDAIISSQTEKITQLTQSVHAANIEKITSPALLSSTPQTGSDPQAHHRNIGTRELAADRAAYEKVAHLFELNQDEGVLLLESLAKQGSTCWQVYNDLAVWYFNQGDNLRAAPYFQRGTELEGKAGSTARNYATMLALTGNMEGALAILGEILHEQPHDEDVLAVIRDILSEINPIPPDTWLKLVSDVRSGQL